jgi:acyl carrier protein
MQDIVDTKFEALVQLIREVKPSLAATPITRDQSLIDSLGLDSLDVVQLARRVRREIEPELSVDAWIQQNKTHHWSIESLLDAIMHAQPV